MRGAPFFPVALAICCLGTGAADPASAAVRPCPGLDGTETKAVGYLGDVSVRNTTCRRASVLLQTAAYYSGRSVRLRGWRCTTVGTYADGGVFRCTRTGMAIRFSAGG